VIFLSERHFWRESLIQGLKSPWALFLTKRVPEVVEICSTDWPEKKISGQSTRKSSRVILSPSYTKWFPSSIALVAWPGQREDSREEFKKKDLTKKRKLQTVPWELKIQAGSNTDLLKVYAILHSYFWSRGRLVEKQA